MANKPNNPSLWSKAKSLAKQKFDVYPSAYANGWAAKWYKDNGGTWSKAAYGMQVPSMMQQGGQATSADSLKVYNNAVNLMNYYKNDGRHHAPDIDEYIGNISLADVSNVGEQNLNMYREMLGHLMNPTKNPFHISQYTKDYGLPIPELVKRVSQAIREGKSAQPGRSYYKDAFPSKIDINSPSAFVDSRIVPQGFVYFRSSVKNPSVSPEPAGSVTGAWYYDPIAVKPAAMRTAKEQAEFDKKYGQKKNTVVRKPTPPVVKKDPPQIATVDNSRTRPSIGNPSVPQLSPNALTQNNMNKSRAVDFWNPSMPGGVQGGWHRRLFDSMEGADNFMKYIRENDLSQGYDVTNSGVNTDADRIQYAYGGNYSMMQDGGEPDGGMAIGQIESSIDKLMNLRKFIQPDSDLEPWISSKLTLMDHYTDAVNDYMQYNPEAQEGEEYEEDEMMMMAEGGGIPQRYKNMGFNKVGVKKKSTRPGKKWMVLAKKGSQYKVVHGGYKGMQDFTQHRNEGRRKNFWNRMGGKGSSKATDPFSPLYWHKRFGTWEEGGQVDDVFANGGYVPVGAPTPQIPISREYMQKLTDRYNQHYSKVSNIQSPMRPAFSKDDGYDSFWYDEYLPSLKPNIRSASGYLVKDAKDPNEKRFVETEKKYPPNLGKNKDNRFSTEWVENYEIQERPSARLESDIVNALADKSRQMSPFLRGNYRNGGYIGYDGKRHMSNTPTWSGNVGYQTGGSISDEERAFEEQQMRDAEAYNVPASQIRIPVEFQETAAPAAKKAVRNTGSVVDYLASQGQASDYATRAKLAASMGIKNYRGTADQNMALLQTLSGAAPKDIDNAVFDNDEPVWTDKSDMPEIVYKTKRRSIFNNPNVKVYSGPFPEQAELRPSSTQLKGTSSKLDPYGTSLIRRDEPLVDSELQAEFRNQLLLNAEILPQVGLPVGPALRAGAKLALSGLRPAIIAGAIRMSPLVDKAAKVAPKAIRAKAAVNVPKNAVSWADKLTPPLQRSLERVRWGNLSMADKLAAAKKGASAFKKDGGIHINPANKGKFTASAQRAGMGVQEFAQHVMANREDYSPTQVKRANFARNAAKWNKQQGGPVVGDEMDVTPAQLEYLRQMGYEFEMI